MKVSMLKRMDRRSLDLEVWVSTHRYRITFGFWILMALYVLVACSGLVVKEEPVCSSWQTSQVNHAVAEVTGIYGRDTAETKYAREYMQERFNCKLRK